MVQSQATVYHIDEKTEKEKKSTVTYLVQANSVNGAIKNIDEVMGVQ